MQQPGPGTRLRALRAPLASTFVLAALILGAGAAFSAESFAPYGTASIKAKPYAPQKIVFDLTTASPEEVAFGLNTIKQMKTLVHKDTQVAAVVIGGGISVFAKDNYEKHQAIIERAAELRDAGVEIKYCGSSTRRAGLKPGDLHGIGEWVPGGLPEIAEYVGKGYVLVRPTNTWPAQPK